MVLEGVLGLCKCALVALALGVGACIGELTLPVDGRQADVGEPVSVREICDLVSQCVTNPIPLDVH